MDHDASMEVAIKMLKEKGDEGKGEFEKEIEIIKKISDENCANFVKYIGKAVDQDCYYLVFERLGRSLHEFVESKGLNRERLRFVDILKIIKQLCPALRALKRLKLVHTDIKTDNILLTRDEHALEVKVIDVGSAKDVSDEIPERDRSRRAGCPNQTVHIR